MRLPLLRLTSPSSTSGTHHQTLDRQLMLTFSKIRIDEDLTRSLMLELVLQHLDYLGFSDSLRVLQREAQIRCKFQFLV